MGINFIKQPDTTLRLIALLNHVDAQPPTGVEGRNLEDAFRSALVLWSSNSEVAAMYVDLHLKEFRKSSDEDLREAAFIMRKEARDLFSAANKATKSLKIGSLKNVNDEWGKLSKIWAELKTSIEGICLRTEPELFYRVSAL